MTWTLSQTFGALAGLVSVGLLCILFREFGYKAGYEKGRKAAEEWIVTMEKEVDEERQKIWREEG